MNVQGDVNFLVYDRLLLAYKVKTEVEMNCAKIKLQYTTISYNKYVQSSGLGRLCAEYLESKYFRSKWSQDMFGRKKTSQIIVK